MKEIDEAMLMDLMSSGSDGGAALWLGKECVVSKESVKPTEGTELALPCTYGEFREWVCGNGFEFILIEADALFYEKYADEEDRREYEEYLERVKGVAQMKAGREERLLIEVDLSDLLAAPIVDVAKGVELHGLNMLDRYYCLYDWLNLLIKAKNKFKKLKDEYENNQTKLIKERIAEVQALLADEQKEEDEGFDATDESREAERIESLLGKVDIHKLMGSSISKIADDCGLNGLGEYERCLHLYDWKRLLEKERKQITSQVCTTDTIMRAGSADEKIAEVQALLGGAELNASVIIKIEPPVKENRMSDINRWLYDTWEEKGKPGGSQFFRILGAFRKDPESPIVGYIPSGRAPRIEWKTERASGSDTRKTIQNKVSGFRKGVKR